MADKIKIKNTRRQNRIEDYNHNRLYKNILTACLSSRRPDGQAEATASTVCKNVEDWIKKRPEITNNDIRRVATKHLKKMDPDAAYMYANQHLII